MRKYKYSKETLDIALEGLQSEDVAQRKKSARFIKMASCSELFGKMCDTLGVQTWFLSPDNYEKLIETLLNESEDKLIWEYLSILGMVCRRYVDHSCYAKDFAKKQTCVTYKERTYEIAKQFSHHSSAIVRQMSASIMAYMGDSDAWDIFYNVMLKKRDFCTISHITGAIGHYCYCTNGKINDSHFIGGTMTDSQQKNLSNSLQSIYQHTSNKSIKGMCLTAIQELESIKEIANNQLNCLTVKG